MDNKTIARVLKSAVEESQKEEVLYRIPCALGGYNDITQTVIDGEKLESKIQTIIEMLESIEENEE